MPRRVRRLRRSCLSARPPKRISSRPFSRRGRQPRLHFHPSVHSSIDLFIHHGDSTCLSFLPGVLPAALPFSARHPLPHSTDLAMPTGPLHALADALSSIWTGQSSCTSYLPALHSLRVRLTSGLEPKYLKYHTTYHTGAISQTREWVEFRPCPVHVSRLTTTSPATLCTNRAQRAILISHADTLARLVRGQPSTPDALRNCELRIATLGILETAHYSIFDIRVEFSRARRARPPCAPHRAARPTSGRHLNTARWIWCNASPRASRLRSSISRLASRALVSRSPSNMLRAAQYHAQPSSPPTDVSSCTSTRPGPMQSPSTHRWIIVKSGN